MVVMDVYTRRIIGFGVAAADLDGVRVCRMFNRAIALQTLPKHLSSDHDPLFRFHRWRANLRVLEVDEIKTIPGTPRSHAFVERLIGTIRREFLDRGPCSGVESISSASSHDFASSLLISIERSISLRAKSVEGASQSRFIVISGLAEV
jgi:transposase InsO family protein